MKILMLNTHDLGVGHYRMWAPARALERAGHSVTFFCQPNGKGDALSNIDRLHGNPTRWLFDNADKFDLIHWGYSTLVAHIELEVALRNAFGKPFIVDYDDDIYNVPPYNMAFKSFHPGAPERRVVRLNAKVADAISTSTSPLSSEFERFGDNPSVFTLPNLYDPSVWTDLQSDPARKRDESVRLLFAGGLGRFGDLSVPAIRESMDILMAKFDGTAGKPLLRLFFIGCAPDWAAKWMTDAHDATKNRAFFIKFMQLDTYFKALKWISPDIMINPVDKNTFNRSKSAIKGLEAGGVGAAFVCTDWATHECLPKGTCLKVDNTTTQWKEALEALIVDESLRQSSSLALSKWVDTQTYDAHINSWVSAYAKVVANGPLDDDALLSRVHTGPKEGVIHANSGSRQLV